VSAAGEEAGEVFVVPQESARVAIVAALPREIAGLARGMRADAALAKRGIRLYRIPGAVVVAAGMGAVRATLAVEAALAAERSVAMLVSVGFAGACAPGLRAGSVLEASVVVDTRTGERFESAAERGGEERKVTLATIGSVASVREKRRLFETYGASMVDMEAATIARLARARGLGFRAIKGISDAHDFELETLAAFAGKKGQFRTAAFAVHAALRPARWARTMKLGRDSAAALRTLEQTLRRVVDSSAGDE
jgi:adenosylhomocysteine nucleosidase